MNNKTWDVIVIGGGPAGMMSAGRAAERGLRVILLEKNSSLGKKLLVTGGGRCNVTNAELDNRKLLERFRDDGKFLFSAFSQWSVRETLDFFHERKMETKIENENRVFLMSNKAQSVWNVMFEYLKQNNVKVISNSPVTHIVCDENGKPVGVKTKNEIIYGSSIIIATGGTSHPETGSTGDAYDWLRKLGHNIVTPTPSLVPLTAEDKWIKDLSGFSLTNIRLTPFLDGVKQNIKSLKNNKIENNKILFTHKGVSGPTILNMSREIGEMIKYGDVVISLDLLPRLDYSELNKKLQDIFKENDKKKFKNSLSQLIPSSMVHVVIELSKIDPDIQCNSITREERVKLMNLLKSIPINIKGLQSFDKAIISSGGVDIKEVDFKTMRSRLHPNIYLVGDVLNIDRPSGGFSLQLCWTTGMVAGAWCEQK